MRGRFSKETAQCQGMKKSNPNSPKPEPNSKVAASQGFEYLSLGWIFAGTMALPMAAGFWIDKHVGTAPLFLLIGALLGLAGCGYSFFRLIQKLNATDKKSCSQ